MESENYIDASTVQSLYNAIFRVHRNGPCVSELCYEEIILQRNYRKMTIHSMVIFL